ncbi:MAG: winged helix-turn-helix transcriptional regulator [Anaerolineae bacterium]|nr:winged helix-turn-helix transcriptional regulator [Anaerolineae bacterium]
MAHAQLARAVELAAPETYIRAFLDEDPQLLSLLPEVRSLAPDFVDHILDDANIPAVQQQITAQALSNQTLIEPLSERELEVLRLIAGGLNNREIATHLFITPGTVKRHINNIYGKLQVHSRTQAVAKARELRVLA